MSVLRPRNRLVYFRVSEDEFQRFNSMCGAIGARSISDLARSAVRQMIEDPGDRGAERVSEKLTLIESMISELNEKVRQLTLTVGRFEPNPRRLSAIPEELNESKGVSSGG